MILRRVLLFLAFLASHLMGGCGRRLPADFIPMYVDGGNLATIRRLPARWSFDCTFPERNRIAVRLGFEYWNSLTDKKIFVEDACGSWDGTGIVVTWSDRNSEVQRDGFVILAMVTDWRIGRHGLDSARITFYPYWFDEENWSDYMTVPRHEAGHVLGFNHFPWKDCLMHSDISVTKKDPPKKLCLEEIIAFLRFY